MGRLTLPESISLDSNIFIASYDKRNVFYKLSKILLEEIKEAAPRVLISVLVFEEFLVKIYAAKLDKGLQGYEDFMSGGGKFTVIDVNRKIARKAAQIRAKYSKIKTPDAIHLGCAIEAGVKMFITTDKGLPEKIEGLKIVNLGDLNLN